MLAEPDDVDADLVGEHCFGDDVAQHVSVGVGLPVGGVGDIAKGVQSKFGRLRHPRRIGRGGKPAAIFWSCLMTHSAKNSSASAPRTPPSRKLRPRASR